MEKDNYIEVSTQSGDVIKSQKFKLCQYCHRTEKVNMWVPAGNICKDCKKNLDKIRKYGLGIPKIKTPRAF
jgi:hypothetical protein